MRTTELPRLTFRDKTVLIALGGHDEPVYVVCRRCVAELKRNYTDPEVRRSVELLTRHGYAEKRFVTSGFLVRRTKAGSRALRFYCREDAYLRQLRGRLVATQVRAVVILVAVTAAIGLAVALAHGFAFRI